MSATTTDGVTIAGNDVRAQSSYTLADGTTFGIFDVGFQTDQVNTEYLGDTSVASDVAQLAHAKGYGALPSLHIAATLSPELQSVLETTTPLLNTPVLSDLIAAVRPLTTAWSQFDGEPLTSNMSTEYTYSYTLDAGGNEVIEDEIVSVGEGDETVWFLQSEIDAGKPIAYTNLNNAMSAL